jgi:hypothetical protein
MPENRLAEELLIVHIFVIIDDIIKNMQKFSRFKMLPGIRLKPGPVSRLSISEIMSLAILKFKFKHQDWKSYYTFIQNHYHHLFPNLPHYANFMRHLKAALPSMLIIWKVLQYAIRNNSSGPYYPDSTSLAVCKNQRISRHKTCRGIAQRSKTTKGWFYGFKLHLCSDSLGQLLSFMITPGNIDDRRVAKKLLKSLNGLVIADAGYLSLLLKEDLSREGIFLFTAVRNSMKRLMTNLQHQLLKTRQRIETVVSVLKERMGIETSLPRSLLGHIAHYVYACIAYALFNMRMDNLLTC